MKTWSTQGRSRRFGYISALFILLMAFSEFASGEIVPDNRRVSWEGKVGVAGGIPARTTVYWTVNASTYGNGTTDATAEIQTRINNCPVGQVVYLPSGTYRVSSPITLKTGITLRGAGMGQTIIKGASSWSGGDRVVYIALGGTGFGTSYNISSGNTKGSTRITTSAAHGLSVGDHVAIDQLEDPSGDPTITHVGYGGTASWVSRQSGTRPLGQWNRVVGVPSSTQVDLEMPLYWSYASSKTPQITKINNVASDVGLEDLTVDNSLSACSFTISLYDAANSWLYRVEGISTVQQMVRIYGAYRLTVQGCKFHEGNPISATSGSAFGPSHGYGLKFENVPSSCNLVQDNIFYHMSMALADEGPFSGNVFAYNYITAMYHADSGTAGEAMTALHGGHPFMNLWEGNYSDGKFASDSYWGSSSHNTIFRNRVLNEVGFSTANWIIDLYGKAQYYNIVGNVLGSTGIETVYEQADASRNTSAKAIYALGYTGSGDSDASGNDPQVKATLLRHGNWDSVHNSTVWDPTIADHTLPSSLYLTAKPSWWGSLPWPPFGPDLSPMTGQIPAQVRYSGGTVPTSPVIALSPASLAFTGVLGGAITATQTVSVVNGGTTNALTWSQSDNASWLLVSPASGTTPGSLRVSANPSGLATGSYTGIITVAAPSASNTPQAVTVSFTVTPVPVPIISVSPSTLAFAAVPGGAVPASQTVNVSNSGTTNVLNWTQSDNASWLSVSPASGITPGTLSVSVDQAGLAEGTYTGVITVAATGASNTPQTVSVTLSVATEPEMTGHYDMTYPNRASLLAAGWDFLAAKSAGGTRNTEVTSGAVVSYDQQAHPGVLRIPCDAGDLWENLNNTRNTLFRDLPAAWTNVKIKVMAFDPAQNYQQAGIVVYQDDDNYVQIYRTYENGDSVGFVRETGGSPSTVKSVSQSATTNLYMRLDRDPATERITAYYSLNNVSWTSLGSVVQPLTNPRLGIVVGASPSGYPPADVMWAEVAAVPSATPKIPMPPRNLRVVP